MKLLKSMTIILIFLALGLGAGKLAGPYFSAWMQPAPIENGDYRDYLKASGQPLVLFSTSTCPHCKHAREYLASHNVAYKDYVIDQSPEAMKIYKQLDEKAVPIFLTANRIIRGFNAATVSKELQQAGLQQAAHLKPDDLHAIDSPRRRR